MKIKQFFRLATSPRKLRTYIELRRDRSDRCLMLGRVTSIRSAQDLHDKIRNIDCKIVDLLK